MHDIYNICSTMFCPRGCMPRRSGTGIYTCRLPLDWYVGGRGGATREVVCRHMHGDEAMMPESVEGRGGRDSVARWCAATCMTHGRLDARSSPSASRTPWPLVLALSLATTLTCQPLPIKTVIRVRVQVSRVPCHHRVHQGSVLRTSAQPLDSSGRRLIRLM